MHSAVEIKIVPLHQKNTLIFVIEYRFFTLWDDEKGGTKFLKIFSGKRSRFI